MCLDKLRHLHFKLIDIFRASRIKLAAGSWWGSVCLRCRNCPIAPDVEQFDRLRQKLVAQLHALGGDVKSATIKASIISAKDNAITSRLEMGDVHIQQAATNGKASHAMNTLVHATSIALNLVDEIRTLSHGNIKENHVSLAQNISALVNGSPTKVKNQF